MVEIIRGCMLKKIKLCFLALMFFVPMTVLADTVWDADVVNGNSLGFDRVNFNVNSSSRIVATLNTSQIRMLLKVRDGISAQSGVYPKLLISDKPILNAWADSSNGANTVTLTFKMLDMIGEDSDKCAALIGHEVTHLKLNHGTKQATANGVLVILASIAGGLIDGALSAKSGVPQSIGTQLTGVVAQEFSNAFSRNDEREADEYGTKWMIDAGYNPQGAIRLHEALLRASGDNGGFLSTHPSSAERISNVQKLIAQYESNKSTKLALNDLPKSSKSLEMPIQQTQSFQSNENAQGQVGVILKMKQKYNYFIFSGTTQAMLKDGSIVYIGMADGNRAPAEVQRAIDGYYSAIFEDKSLVAFQGERVFIEGVK